MTRLSRLHLRDGVATFTLAGAEGVSGGGFDPAQRVALAEALDLTLADPAVRALILRGAGAGWPVADDPGKEFAAQEGAPDLRALAARIAMAGKPVLAALSGQVSGGALALALACGWRLADPETRIFTSETARGLLPAGGALVRLARRLGGAAALRLTTSQVGWSAGEALVAGLLDAVPDDGPVDAAAFSLAQAALAGTAVARPDDAGLAEPAAYLAELAPIRGALGRGPMAAVLASQCDVVEAALLLPLEEALDFEAVAYGDLAAAPLALGLAHIAKAELATARLAGCAAASVALPGPLRLGLWQVPGGADLALLLLTAGHGVTLGAPDRDSLADGFSAVAHVQEAAVQAGDLDPEAREADWARLGAATDLAGLSGLDLVIAAGDTPPEALRKAVGPGAVLALLSVSAPPSGTLGLRLAGDLCEIILPGPEEAEAAGQLAAVLRGIGNLVVRGGRSPGSIADHLHATLHVAAERCVLAGARPAEVDQALGALGFAEGPFVRADRIGLGALVADLRRLGQAPGAASLYLFAEGQTGRVAGQGYYRYDGVQPVPAAGLDAVLGAIRHETGLAAKPLTRTEIQTRVLAELAGEGARMLQTGAAHRASDIDLVAVRAVGLGVDQGGPMFQADRRGLLSLRNTLRALAREGAMAPVALWDVLIRNGRHFGDLNAD